MMGFEVQQIRKLRAKLKPRNIRTRQSDGITLSYIEGWHVIAEANRIFGFDGWDRETVETKCVWTKQNGSRFSAAYVTRIRITVKAGGSSIVREGSGAGEANSVSPGQAHEMAAKAAETDATKRALMTFGNAFGLSLYSGGHLASPQKSPATPERKPRLEHAKAGAHEAQTSLHAADATSQKQNEEIAQACDNTPTCVDSTNLPEWPTFDPLEEAARKANVKGKIDKSALSLGEPRRLRDPDHLRRVASRPCLICGRNRTQAHHLKFLQPNAMGRKVSDEFTVPLCSTHHGELHATGNEKSWWQGQGIDPEPVAKKLWQDTLASKAAPYANIANRSDSKCSHKFDNEEPGDCSLQA